jgi:hypothetical protein
LDAWSANQHVCLPSWLAPSRITVGGADEAIVREGLRTSLAPDAGCSHLAEPTLPKSSFEQIERFTEAATGTVYPRLIEALGVGPPDDVGGPWRCYEFPLTLILCPPQRGTALFPRRLGSLRPVLAVLERLAEIDRTCRQQHPAPNVAAACIRAP